MSIASINTTYTPGMGYSRVLKDGPGGKVCQCWGKEFEENLKTALAQAAVKQTEAAKNAPSRAKLTDDDIKELAQKYNPASMTRDQYDYFLEDLSAKGVLTRDEMGYLGYKGMVYLDLSHPSPIKITAPQIDLNDPLAQKWMYGGYSLSGGLFRFDGTPNDEMDLTLSAKMYNLFTPSEKKEAYSYYGALYDVVQRMDRLR